MHLHVWRKVLNELRDAGVASAVYEIWLLRRHSRKAWLAFAEEVPSHNLTRQQLYLVASLWELSRELDLEDIAPRLAHFTDSFCGAFQ